MSFARNQLSRCLECALAFPVIETEITLEPDLTHSRISAMKFRDLGNTGIKVSEIGFGEIGRAHV